MKCDFKPGEQVVCVNAAGQSALIEGATYTVHDLYIGESGKLYCRLEGVATITWATSGMYVERFRPLAKRSDTLNVESFLTIKPGFEEPRRRVVEPVKEGA